MANDDYAIVIGIQVYPGLDDPTDPDHAPLQGPENDAKAFAAWLTAADGGAVPPEHVDLILSSAYHPPFASVLQALPVTQDIENAFLKLYMQSEANNKETGEVRVGRRLYIYMAGHGLGLGGPQDSEAGLLMANVIPRAAIYCVPGKSAAQWVAQAGFFDEVVLIMDCCRDQYPLAPRPLPFLPITGDLDQVGNVKYFYALGARWARPAREQQMEDGQWHGVFTTALLKGLKEGLARRSRTSRKITGISLRDFLYHQVPDSAQPDILCGPPEGQCDSFVFVELPAQATRPAEVPVIVHLPDTAAGQPIQVRRDKDFRVVASTTATPPVWQVALKPGMYLVQLAGAADQVAEVQGEGEVHVRF
jgi:uncharacterized caspase-like protein